MTNARDWVKLGEYVDIIRGVSYKPKDLHSDLNDNSAILLRANNINNGLINHDEVYYVDKSRIREDQYLCSGDILICASSGSKALVGKAAIIKNTINETFGTFCLLVRPHSINSNYLGHYFQSNEYRNEIESLCSCTNINNLKPSHFNDLLIRIPDSANQALYSEILDVIQYRLISLQKLISTLDTLIKARFVEMFGTHYDWDSSVSKTQLGNLCWLGSSKRIHRDEYVSDGVPFYRTKEIAELSNGKKPTSELFISRSRFDEIDEKSGSPIIGDLLISAVGTIGKIWVVNINSPFYFKDGNLIWVKPKNANSIFLKYLLQELIVNNQNELTGGTAYKALTIISLSQMEVVVPPLFLQQQFADFVEKVEEGKGIAKEMVEKLQMLYDSLAQEYFAR